MLDKDMSPFAWYKVKGRFTGDPNKGKIGRCGTAMTNSFGEKSYLFTAWGEDKPTLWLRADDLELWGGPDPRKLQMPPGWSMLDNRLGILGGTGALIPTSRDFWYIWYSLETSERDRRVTQTMSMFDTLQDWCKPDPLDPLREEIWGAISKDFAFDDRQALLDQLLEIFLRHASQE